MLDLEGKVAAAEILRPCLCSSVSACLVRCKEHSLQALSLLHMDFGSVAEKESVNALTEQVQHLANKNVSMKVCGPFLGHWTSALQMKS